MKNMIYIHEASRQYIYPIRRNCLKIKLIGAYQKNVSCSLVYWNRQKDEIVNEISLFCYARDKSFSYYKCSLEENEAVKYLRYYFEIKQNDETVYLNKYGMQKTKPKDGFFEYLYTNSSDVFIIPDWTKGAIFYQIFPERFYNGNKGNDSADIKKWESKPTRTNYFGGDIEGIIAKLDYLSSLMIDAIYLTPIFEAPANHKYDTIDYFKIDSSFGTMADLKNLVKSCHALGIKVVLDGVFNHCGYYFKPFQDVLKFGEKSKYKDWFYINEFPVVTDPPNYECVGNYKWMPKINFSCQDARDYFLEVGEYWIREANIDGWRMDVSDEVDYTFWCDFRKKIKKLNSDVVLIGETWKENKDLLAGDQMDSVMNYVFRDAVVDFIAKKNIDVHEFDNRIQKLLAIYPEMVYPSLYNLIGSHDTERFLTSCGGDVDKMKLAVVFQMTFPGMPAIYYGDEIGMVGENDPDCRKTMTWDNINNDIHGFYKKLIETRKSDEALCMGTFSSIVCNDGVYGFFRKYKKKITYILINNSDNEKTIQLPLLDQAIDKEYFSLLNKKPYISQKFKGNNEFFNSDIYKYKSFFEVTLPKFHFEIINSKGELEK